MAREPSAEIGFRSPSILMGLLALVLATAPALAHPKPGAHADVRISVEPDAVRLHIVMNIRFADQIVNVPRASRDDVNEQEGRLMGRALAEYFGAAREGPTTSLVDQPNRVRIDGVDVSPVIGEIRVIRPEPESRPGFVQNPALLLPQIFAVVEYPCKAAPENVSIVWGTYPRDFIAPDRDAAPISDVEAVLTSRDRLDLITFRQSEPEFTWHAPIEQRAPPLPGSVVTPGDSDLRVPSASVLVVLLGVGGICALTRARRLGTGGTLAAAMGVSLAAAAFLPLWRVPLPGANSRAVLDPTDACEVFAPLHANIYRAFDYSRETDIYDALARSVDGPLLDTVYNGVYRGLILQEEGGALSRVKAVTPLETTVVPPESSERNGATSFGVLARWRVEGIVYHWGHSHARTNEYTARYTVAPRQDGWRIVAVVPIEQRRIESDVQANSGAQVGAARTPAPFPPTPSGSTWRPDR